MTKETTPRIAMPTCPIRRCLEGQVALVTRASSGIAPGAVRTPINADAWSTTEAYEQPMKLIPYKRIGEPEEIGRTAIWLASDESGFINGSTIFVDGGMTLYPGFETGG